MSDKAVNTSKIPLFIEKQRFTQWWLWFILYGLMCIPLVGLVQQLLFAKPFGNKPMSDTGLLLFTLGMVLFLLFFRTLYLGTSVYSEYLHIRFYPFISKKIIWLDVSRAEMVTYGFLGYGIKLWTPYGTVYNIKGNRGLVIQLNNEKKYLLGTQKPDELEAVLKKVLPWA